MKFIIRELYEGIQGEPGTAEDDAGLSRWRQACELYSHHLRAIRAALPPGMQAFSETTLHDGVVRAVAQPTPSELMLEVDATGNPWGPRGVFRVTFAGVKEVCGLEHLAGDHWLYEEVHSHASAGFEYHVMFDRSDFRVAADEVEVQRLPADRPAN